jgi:hypothetical protein
MILFVDPDKSGDAIPIVLTLCHCSFSQLIG